MFLPLLDPPCQTSKISDNTYWSNILPDGEGRRHSSCEPVRSKASSPPSPTTSESNHVQFNLTTNINAETIYLSSGEQSPIRGRTLRRMPARSRLASHPAHRRLSSVTSGIDPGALRERLMSRDLVTEPEEYLAGILLEPRPFQRLRTYSLSEELRRASSVDSTIDLSRFADHRDTFAMLGLQRLPLRAAELPLTIFRHLLRYLDFDTYKAIRLTCRSWSEGITCARPILPPAANRVPTEILERIYNLLEPHDFNNTRHSCRSWMITSLDEKLLHRMLQQGGWFDAAKRDLARLQSTDERRLSCVSANWLLSKRLATECELSLISAHDEAFRERLTVVESRSLRQQPTLTSEIDFGDLARKGRQTDSDPSLRFVVSVCQNYLLVTKDKSIYVYMLSDPEGSPSHEYGGHFHAVASISCPERVLAVSMDTSCDRLSVAALLDERFGLVSDIPRRTILPSRKGTSTSRTPPAFRANRNRSLTVINGPYADLLAWNSDGSYASQDFSQCPEFCDNSGGRDIYHNLCSAHDPPRSIAIFRQRRCVAFGNSSGIEIHWLDVLSGQELQRWFPLSSPSDCLYFLPNRAGIDSNRKLRVIASADHPVQAKIANRMYPSRIRQLKRKRSWDLSNTEDDAWKLEWTFSQMSSSGTARSRPEHFNARPLSDGHNVIFTDPQDGKLYLGGDTRPGQGIPQLMRRFAFEGPLPGFIPYIYAGAQELKWGIRVIAGYACEHDLHAPRQVWLFSVPIDLFSSPAQVSIRQHETSDSGFNTISAVPHRVQGIHIATIRSLAEVSINASDGDLTIHAFSASECRGYTWQLAGGGRECLKLAVLSDGISTAVVTDGQDEGRDVVMRDASPIPFHRERNTWQRVERNSAEFDGASGEVGTPGMARAPRNTDEDVVMEDAPPVASDGMSIHRESDPEDPMDMDEGYFSGEEAEGRGVFQRTGGPFAIHVPPMREGQWSDGSADWVPDYLAEHGTDVEDEGQGVDLWTLSRLELEMLGL